MNTGPTAAWRMSWLVWIVAGLCMLSFAPGLDIAFSNLFYTPGAGFDWPRGGLLSFVREAVPTLILGTLLFCLLLWAAGLMSRETFWALTTRRMGYLVATLALGPGLLVEAVLKSHWGRARPNDLAVFGGDAIFTPPVLIAQECASNCSFVSGHAAIAFWVTAYGFLLPAPWRVCAVTMGMIFGALVGLVRVIQGAHFLSDVVFAGALVLTVNLLLARFILSESRKRVP